nr:MAG TPA: hypothetical protein [Caudoviricetes sp.]
MVCWRFFMLAIFTYKLNSFCRYVDTYVRFTV